MLINDPNIWHEIIVDKTNILLTLLGHSQALDIGINKFGIHISPTYFFTNFGMKPTKITINIYM